MVSTTSRIRKLVANMPASLLEGYEVLRGESILSLVKRYEETFIKSRDLEDRLGVIAFIHVVGVFFLGACLWFFEKHMPYGAFLTMVVCIVLSLTGMAYINYWFIRKRMGVDAVQKELDDLWLRLKKFEDDVSNLDSENTFSLHK